MTELDLGIRPISRQPALPEDKHEPSQKRRVTIVLVLSLLAPGLGQIYERRLWRGLAMALSLGAILLVTGELRLLLTFAGLVGSLLLGLFWRLWVTGDAVYLACKERAAPKNSRYLWLKSAAATAIILLLEIYPTPDFLLNRWAYFRAFSIPSQSMCPTICIGDRIVANMDAYKTVGLQRGDIILFDKDESNAKWIKRVAAIAGDTVAPGSNGEILVNGKPIVFPRPCGKAVAVTASQVSTSPFEPMKVPPGTVYLIGDNVDNSYDSRHFGSIPMTAVKGKPLFIYWSPDHSRVSCKIW